MKKRFKASKKHFNILKIVIILIISFSITYFLKDHYEFIFKNSINNIDSYFKFNLFKKDFFIKYAILSEASNKDDSYLGDYIKDIGTNDIANNIDIYIYNSHQTESYQYQKINPYNVYPTVLLASYSLREKLKDYKINAYVETNNIAEILRANNWNYKYSYEASRLLIKDFLANNNPKLIIDLHRDSASYEKTTTIINGDSYAKVLLVVGKKHENYLTNFNLANQINDLIKNEDNSLSRGISLKDGKGVNGIYNQDLASNMILLELGGQYNTFLEIDNTLNIVAKVLYLYLNGNTQKE